jgi:hypothetical protein
VLRARESCSTSLLAVRQPGCLPSRPHRRPLGFAPPPRGGFAFLAAPECAHARTVATIGTRRITQLQYLLNLPWRPTSENAVKAKSDFRERFPSNKRSVSMFPATSGKGTHVLPTSRRPRFVLVPFGGEEIRPSRLSHLQPNQYDPAPRCPNRRVLRRARHRERTSIRLRCMHELRILDFLRHGVPT